MPSLEAQIIRGEALDVLRTLPSESVGGVITDVPYSSGGQFRGDRVGGKTATEKYIKEHEQKYEHDFAGDNRDQRSFLTWCTLWMSEALRVTMPGGVFATFIDWRQLPTVTDAIQAGGWIWRGIIPWDKTEATRPQPARPRAQAEFIAWGSRGPMDPNRDAPVIPGVLYDGPTPSSPGLITMPAIPPIIRAPTGRGKIHPTEKSVPMLRTLVQIVERGLPILDPFCGSGAHGEAALLEGHPFVGIEMSEHYAAVSKERIEQAIAAHGLDAEQVRELERRGARVGGPVQVSLFDG